jgi:hypothetical protein
MARWWIGLLLLLNTALLAWNLGALLPWGWGPAPAQAGTEVTLALPAKAVPPVQAGSDAASAAASDSATDQAPRAVPPASAASSH